MHLFYRTADHALARNTFVSAEHIWCAIVSIYVGGNEINRDVLVNAMLDESIGPGGLRCGRTAHAETITHSLNGCDRVIVKLPVGRLFGLAHPEIDIRFVPDFEVPLRNLIHAVAI